MLKVEGLEKYYGNVRAIRGVDLEVGDSEIFALIGPNGAGKTTTIKCVMGFLNCSGRLTFNGEELNERVRVERFSFLPEEKRLYKSMRVKDLVKVVGRYGFFDIEKLERSLELFSIDISVRVSYLSHGMRTALYLSIVLSKDADFFLLDEPTWGLDPVHRKLVFDLMNDVVSSGSSILYTSHVLPEVERMADRVAIMKSGEIVFCEELETVRKEYRIAFSRVEPTGNYEFVKRVEAGYLVLAKEEELEDVFETIAPADIEDVFDVVVGGDGGVRV